MPVLKVYKNDNGILVKECNKCNEIQPTSDFYKQKMFCKSDNNHRYYPINMCKKCKSDVYKMKKNQK